MDLFFKATAGVLIASILGLILGDQGKLFLPIVSLAGCCMVVLLAISFLEPVLDLMCRIETLGQLNSEVVKTLFKVVGIGLVSEVAGMICNDAGNKSLAKALQILGSFVILWLSVPIFDVLLSLIQKILGDL